MRLMPAKQAAQETGLSVWELHRGYKAGIYPAIVIGRGDSRKRIRFDLDALEAAIREQMKRGGAGESA